jgi:hypothetical protein
MMIDRRWFSVSLSAAAIAFLAGRHAATASAEAADFYRGKTVRILVGSPPGGGYDLYARLIAPHLAAKIGATVLVENRDGQGGLAALAALMVRPADGLTIMHASAEAAILSQMLQRPGVTWDVTKLNWLAKTSMAPKLWYVGANAPYPTIKDAARANPLTWSATGPADNISDAGGDHFIRAGSQVQGHRRLSRRRRHVARRHSQRGRLGHPVRRHGLAAHHQQCDQAARHLQPAEMAPFAGCADLKRSRCPPRRQGMGCRVASEDW